MGVKSVVPVCHWYHFRDWRLGGVAFETRFSSYIESNRTLASYLPGRRVIIFDHLIFNHFSYEHY